MNKGLLFGDGFSFIGLSELEVDFEGDVSLLLKFLEEDASTFELIGWLEGWGRGDGDVDGLIGDGVHAGWGWLGLHSVKVIINNKYDDRSYQSVY